MHVHMKRNQNLGDLTFRGAHALSRVVVVIVVVVIAVAAVLAYIVFKKDGEEPTAELNPVLFVHGWTKTAEDWHWMINKFVSDGWPREMLYAHTFSDPMNCSSGANAKNAGEIAAWVDQILAETGAEKVDLVSHSMGGLSTRYYIKFLGGIDKVEDYVCLASPQHGRTGGTGELIPDSVLMENLNDGDETPGGVLPDTEDWRDDPAGEGGYNCAHIPGNITWTAIRSNIDILVKPPETAILDGAENLEHSIGHSAFPTDEQVYELVKAALE